MPRSLGANFLRESYHPRVPDTSHEPTTPKRFFAENPLAVFSFYTHGQVVILQTVAADVRGALDDSFCAEPQHLDGRLMRRAHGLFWLWVLGAYEVVRTMAQGKDCFSPSAAYRVAAFKKQLTLLRIPFAKQEQAAAIGGGPIYGELSISGFFNDTRDFSYHVDGTCFKMRQMLDEFDMLVDSITSEDVLNDFRRSGFFNRWWP